MDAHTPLKEGFFNQYSTRTPTSPDRHYPATDGNNFSRLIKTMTAPTPKKSNEFAISSLGLTSPPSPSSPPLQPNLMASGFSTSPQFKKPAPIVKGTPRKLIQSITKKREVEESPRTLIKELTKSQTTDEEINDVFDEVNKIHQRLDEQESREKDQEDKLDALVRYYEEQNKTQELQVQHIQKALETVEAQHTQIENIETSLQRFNSLVAKTDADILKLQLEIVDYQKRLEAKERKIVEDSIFSRGEWNLLYFFGAFLLLLFCILLFVPVVLWQKVLFFLSSLPFESASIRKPT